jgi:hypothetical protein
LPFSSRICVFFSFFSFFFADALSASEAGLFFGVVGALSALADCASFSAALALCLAPSVTECFDPSTKFSVNGKESKD